MCILVSVVTREKEPTCKTLVQCENNIKMHLHKVGWKAQTGLIGLRIGTGGRLLIMK